MIGCLLAHAASTGFLAADTIVVDAAGFADFVYIQDAIEAAVNGDQVVVLPGVYTAEDPSSTSVVDLMGKQLILASFAGPETCIIDGEFSRRGIVCTGGEHDADISGFTVRNCAALGNGAGMQCIGSGPELRNCVFTENYAIGSGGGLHVENASMTITTCLFSSNGAIVGGGLNTVATDLKAPHTVKILECEFISNAATTSGAQLAADALAQLTIIDCQLSSADDVDSLATTNTGSVLISQTTFEIGMQGTCEQQAATVAVQGGMAHVSQSTFGEMGHGISMKIDTGSLLLQEVLFQSEGSGCQSEAALMASDADIVATNCSWSNIRRGPQIQTSGACDLTVTESTFDGIGPSNAQPYNAGIIAGPETRLSISGSLFTNLCHGVICHDHGGLTVTGTEFVRNTTEYADEPFAIHLHVHGNGNGDATLIENCTFNEGRVWSELLYHDAVTLSNIGALTVTGCEFKKNWGINPKGDCGGQCAPFGSALSVTTDDLDTTEVLIQNSSFINNGGGTGGIFGGYASAISSDEPGPTRIHNCRFTNNNGTGVGAVRAKADFTNCLFEFNKGSIWGIGAALVDGSMTDCTIYLSTSDCGEGALVVRDGASLERVTILDSRTANDWESLPDCCDWNDEQLGGCLHIGSDQSTKSDFCVDREITGVTIRDSLICNGSPTEIHGAYTDLGGNVISPICCRGDLNHDRSVDGGDLAIILGMWNQPCLGCQVDLDYNGMIDGADLSLLLGFWGACPN